MTARCTSARATRITTWAATNTRSTGCSLTVRSTGPLPSTRRRIGRWKVVGVHVDAEGVTFAANLRVVNDATYPVNLTIRRFTFDGEEISRWDFPSLAAVPNAVSVLGDEVYIGGYDLETGQGIAGRLSGAPLLKPALAQLDGSVSGSAERLAVLDHHYGAGPVTARVQVPGADTGLRWLSAMACGRWIFSHGGHRRQRPRRARRAEQGAARRGDRRQRER